MRVLVATKRFQGRRRNDFSYTREGELVKFCLECDGEEVDGNCGCRRSMSGVDTLLATTTFEVVERPRLTKAAFVKKLAASEKKAGWKMTAAEVRKGATELLRLAEAFPQGVVLEKRGDTIQAR